MKTSAVDKGRRSVDVMRGNVDAAAARSFSWVEELQNDTGLDILEGSVVAVRADGTIELCDIENDSRPIGVVVDQIDDGDTGQVVFGGPVDLILVTTSVTAGQFGNTSTTPGQAQISGAGNALCEFNSSGTSPSAFIFPDRNGRAAATASSLLVEDLSTAETNTALVPHPDGTGGVVWGVDATGGGAMGWFLPEDYGAVGDDSTDDTTAMQDWLAALNGAGRGFAYLANRYKVTAAIGSLTVPCTILGAGMAGNEIPGAAASFIHYAGTSAIVVLDIDSPGVKIDGLGFVQTGGSPSSGCTAIRAGNATAADFAQLLNVSTSGFDIGLDFLNGTAFTIERCLFHGFKQYGASIQYVSIPEGGDASIVSTHFDGATYDAQAGLHIASSGGLKVANCKTNSESAHPLTNGIELLVPTATAVTVFLFANNSIEGWDGNGFLATTTGTGTLNHVSLVGNEISSTISAGHTAAGFVAASAGEISQVVVVGNDFGDSGDTVTACQFTNVDEVTVGPNEWKGYSVEATFTTCTNVHDRTGGVAAGVEITGTPSSGDVPIASSGTAAAWGAPSTSPTGAAGGDLSGTYPNPSVVDDSHNHTAATLPDTSGLISVEPYDTYSVSGTPPAVTITTKWGVSAGVPYYDAAGAVSGEEAALYYDPTIDEFVLVEYGF